MLNELNPNNDYHRMTSDEFIKLAHAQNTITKLTKTGAPRPAESSLLWNEWAANNPTPQASALANFDSVGNLEAGLLNKTGILGSAARPID